MFCVASQVSDTLQVPPSFVAKIQTSGSSSDDVADVGGRKMQFPKF